MPGNRMFVAEIMAEVNEEMATFTSYSPITNVDRLATRRNCNTIRLLKRILDQINSSRGRSEAIRRRFQLRRGINKLVRPRVLSVTKSADKT